MQPGRMDFGLREPAWAVLERERRHKPFQARAGDVVLRFRAAEDVPAGLLVKVAADWRLFLGYCVENTDDLPIAAFSWWKAEHLLRLYRRHYGLNPLPEQDERLLGLLDQDAYREAIEVDLAEVYHGADLGELFRTRQWRRLLGMIERLRRSTHFGEAMANDEQLAEFVIRKKKDDDDDRPPERRMSEFTVEAELLTLAVDRLGELIAVTAASRGGRMRPVKPLPRPVSAVQKLRTKSEQIHVQFTLDRIFGLVDENGQPTGLGAGPPAS